MGGSALQWRTTLTEDLTPRSFIRVELSMRKVGPPGVVIGWELLLVEQAEAYEVTSNLQRC